MVILSTSHLYNFPQEDKVWIQIDSENPGGMVRNQIAVSENTEEGNVKYKSPQKQAQSVALTKSDLPSSADCAERDPQSLEIQQLFECLPLSAHNKREGKCHPHRPESVFRVRNYWALIGTGAFSV